MSKKTAGAGDPNMPLPDPDQVKATFERTVEKFQENRRLYTGIGVVFLLGVLAALYFLNLPQAEEASRFGPLWQRCQRVRDKLAVNTSANVELAELEAYLDELRDSPQEGYALWFLGVYHYREAWTPDKATFDDRKPHLEKAIEFLGRLKEERFDDLLLAKPRWFTASNSTPIDQLYRQAKADLEFAEASGREDPQPDTSRVAVLRTSLGDIHLHFFRELAPAHTENFIRLATLGTYNGTAFHFVRRADALPGTEAKPLGLQGGDPLTFFYNDPLKKEHILRWGTGGVGYDLPPEEARFKVSHRARIVTSQMRDKADWDNGAQFMIMLDADPSLDRRHTPFARVAEGFDIVQKAADRKTAAEHTAFRDDFAFTTPATRGLVVEPVIIHKVIVYENGKALDHAFPLAEGEQALASLGGTPVETLPEDQIYGGRKLRFTTDPDGGAVRRGLDIPFPDDIEVEGDKEPDPRGERKAG